MSPPVLLVSEPDNTTMRCVLVMKHNRTAWLLSVAIFMPFVWLVATSPAQSGVADLAMTGGALGTGLVLLKFLWRGQRQGRWAAHRCVTCDRAMRRILDGELRPPAAGLSDPAPLWRCSHCGRLH